jgi:hypothetical protein
MDYPGVALASSIAVDWKVILVDFGANFEDPFRAAPLGQYFNRKS